MSDAVPEPREPVDAAHDGWTQLPPRSFGIGKSFVAVTSGDRLRVSHFIRDGDQAMVGRAWFGAEAEGPPGHAHGGAIAAILDDAMGAGAWLAGHRVLAAKLEIDFRKPVPLGTTTTFEASVERAEGKRVTMRASMWLPDGALAAEGTGLFIVIDMARLRAGGPPVP